jgi:hypothetical protein
MKLTKSKLIKLIKEELTNIREANNDPWEDAIALFPRMFTIDPQLPGSDARNWNHNMADIFKSAEKLRRRRPKKFPAWAESAAKSERFALASIWLPVVAEIDQSLAKDIESVISQIKSQYDHEEVLSDEKIETNQRQAQVALDALQQERSKLELAIQAAIDEANLSLEEETNKTTILNTLAHLKAALRELKEDENDPIMSAPTQPSKTAAEIWSSGE